MNGLLMEREGSLSPADKNIVEMENATEKR